MSFERYPEYKASGVPWMREVPVHWDVIAAKKGIAVLTDFTANGSFASLAENVEYQSSGFARLIRMTDLRSDLQEEGIWIDEHAYSYLSKSALYGGELLMASVGSVGLIYLMPSVPYKASLAPNMYLIKTNEGLHSKFLYWFLLSQSGQDQIRQAATTTAQPKLNKDNVRGLWISQPELSEQTAIATFLDHETAKIDALVAEQEKLITLLQEKRQAVISHAVTKGLNPNVPMKDSGVEWLGEVPEHWEVKRLRNVTSLNPSKAEVGHLPRDTEVSFLPMEDVGDDGTLNLRRTRPIAEVESGYTYFREGDVTIAKITPCFENGKGAVMRGLNNGYGFGTTELIVVRPCESKVTSNYLHLLFISIRFRLLGESFMYGAGGQKRVPDDFVRDFLVALPPLAEQEEIKAFLECETGKLDSLVTHARSAIAILQERRTALISAVVTGQIDVRNWPAQESA